MAPRLKSVVLALALSIERRARHIVMNVGRARDRLRLEIARRRGAVVIVHVESAVLTPGGILTGCRVTYGRVPGFLPRSELALRGPVDELIGSSLPAIAMPPSENQDEAQLLFSHCLAIEKQRRDYLLKLSRGQRLQGRVGRLIGEDHAIVEFKSMQFGTQLEGLKHQGVGKLVSRGDAVEVVVLEIDLSRNKLLLRFVTPEDS